MNRPRHNVCEYCGRNAHKVALKFPATSNGRFPSGTRVAGFCPSCIESMMKAQSWHDDGWIPFAKATLIYDRRADRTKAKSPLPAHLTGAA